MIAVKKCAVCGKTFLRNGKALCCSDKCSRIRKSRQNTEYKRAARQSCAYKCAARRSRVYKCAWCGKEMTEDEVCYKDPVEENWIFCSRKCAIATFTDKFFAMKDAGEIVDKLDDWDIRNVNTVR